ncbi:hypothetical protein [Rufibacter sp. DG15C]|jgi:hypothetical protein|uniref:hypothetical protein n=1 Tax=Rufibacter sp. DG15C TaxID=1379909 RepID=UPI00082C3AA3|nr:hypothetical protein [Rufibacter sp. DG15C]
MSEQNFPEWQQLLELPLTKTTRLGHVQYFHFGRAHVTNSSGLILDVGAWTLEVSCFWQVEEGGKITVDHQEAQIPRDTQALADPNFDPMVPGANLRDRKLQDLVRRPIEELKVWQVQASPEGEVRIALSRGVVLHIQPKQGVLGEELFWRLFSNVTPGQSVGVGPNGIIRT